MKALAKSRGKRTILHAVLFYLKTDRFIRAHGLSKVFLVVSAREEEEDDKKKKENAQQFLSKTVSDLSSHPSRRWLPGNLH